MKTTFKGKGAATQNRQARQAQRPGRTVICQAFASRCSICGTHLEDDICAHGHEVGKQYPIGSNR